MKRVPIREGGKFSGRFRSLGPYTCDSCEITSEAVQSITLTHHTMPTPGKHQVHGMGAIRLCPDCWALTGVRCDICSISGRKTKVIRLNMNATLRQPGKPVTSRGKGSLYICQKCWTNIAAPRRRGRYRPPPADADERAAFWQAKDEAAYVAAEVNRSIYEMTLHEQLPSPEAS